MTPASPAPQSSSLVLPQMLQEKCIKAYVPFLAPCGFFYHPSMGFYALVAGRYPYRHLHTRATMAELYETALRPDDPDAPPGESSSSSSLPPSDTPPIIEKEPHWYKAQLFHYGIKKTLDIVEAKRRFRMVSEAGLLRVPDWIMRLELLLKDNYLSFRKDEAEIFAAVERERAKNIGPFAVARFEFKTISGGWTFNDVRPMLVRLLLANLDLLLENLLLFWCPRLRGVLEE